MSGYKAENSVKNRAKVEIWKCILQNLKPTQSHIVASLCMAESTDAVDLHLDVDLKDGK